MNISQLENCIGYQFKDIRLLNTALTHSSYRREHSNVREDNERLEFIGDGILDAVIALYLYKKRPDLSEGKLTKLRALIVCERALAEVGRKISLGDHLLLGAGESKSGGASKDSIIADAMEAVFGAILIDGGYEACEKVVLNILTDTIREALEGRLFSDYKS